MAATEKLKFNRVGGTNRAAETSARANVPREADEVAVGDIQKRPPGRLRTEATVGWVDIKTVFPMGSEVINIDGGTNRGQPRKNFDPDKMRRLAEDIAENGQEVPILVRRVTSRHASHVAEYGIIGGERRWRAMTMNGAPEILVRIMTADTRRAYRRAVINDVHNVAHSPVERGRSLLEFKSDMDAELFDVLEKAGFSQSKIPLTPGQLDYVAKVNSPVPIWIKEVLENAKEKKRRPSVNWNNVSTLVGLGVRQITNYTRLAGLDEAIVDALDEEKISAMHGIIIAGLKTESQRKKLLRAVIKDDLNVEDTKERAKLVSIPLYSTTTPTSKWKKKVEKVEEEAPAEDYIGQAGRAMKVNADLRADEQAADTPEKQDRFKAEWLQVWTALAETFERMGFDPREA